MIIVVGRAINQGILMYCQKHIHGFSVDNQVFNYLQLLAGIFQYHKVTYRLSTYQ